MVLLSFVDFPQVPYPQGDQSSAGERAPLWMWDFLNPSEFMRKAAYAMKKRAYQAYPYWMCIPALVFIAVFYLLPILLGIGLSMTSWNIKRPNEFTFVGLENYISIWADPEFLRSAQNTLVFALVILVVRNVLALALAMALVKPLKTARFLRSIFYLPSVLCYVVVGIMFRALFQMNGLVNQGLSAILSRTVQIDWVGSHTLALPTVMLLDLWVWVGFHMMIYIAGLQTISPDNYEAATVDGAHAWQKFRKITLPLLAPTIRTSVVLTLCGGLRVFESVKVLTNGGPGWASTTINVEVYKLFAQGFYGRATAVEMMLALVVFILTQVITAAFRRREMELA